MTPTQHAAHGSSRGWDQGLRAAGEDLQSPLEAGPILQACGHGGPALALLTTARTLPSALSSECALASGPAWRKAHDRPYPSVRFPQRGQPAFLTGVEGRADMEARTREHTHVCAHTRFSGLGRPPTPESPSTPLRARLRGPHGKAIRTGLYRSPPKIV